jgi:Domain of unknown function (DUF3471)
MAFAAAYGLGEKPREREMTPMPAESMERFAGNYAADFLGKISIRVEGDHLLVVNERIGSVQLFPAKGTTFFSLGETPDVTFTLDDHGLVSGFSSGNLKAKKL